MTSTRRLPLVIAAAAILLAPAAPGRAAVVVELFTSQGCSTCPPADRLLSAMGHDPQLGANLVPLAFHVDYWDHAGWRDPFSDAAWSQRQTAYVKTAGGTQVFTPQLVVDGAAQCVGSDIPCIHAAVDAAAARPAGRVEVTLGAARGDTLPVSMTAQLPDGPRSADVMVAVYESDLDTAVGSGENAKKTLHDDFVVRRLQRAFTLSGAAARQETLSVSLLPEWRRGHLGVAVFLQDPRSHQIFGGAVAALPGG